jgi:hypothetical protein
LIGKNVSKNRLAIIFAQLPLGDVGQPCIEIDVAPAASGTHHIQLNDCAQRSAVPQNFFALARL